MNRNPHITDDMKIAPPKQANTIVAKVCSSYVVIPDKKLSLGASILRSDRLTIVFIDTAE